MRFDLQFRLAVMYKNGKIKKKKTKFKDTARSGRGFQQEARVPRVDALGRTVSLLLPREGGVHMTGV
jgi:hypothetical protein